MVLWMKVTKDEYELPLYVSSSLQDIANKFGVSTETIRTSATRKSRESCWKRIVVEDD